MKKILKPIWLFTCLAGYIVIGALNEFGFGAAVGVGLMALGLFVALGAIAVKQISAIRNYWDSGRGSVLLSYAVLSYGIAAIGKLLSNLVGLPFPAFESLWLWAMTLLPLVWLVIVIKGIKKSGWPGIILVLPAWWGMFWWIQWAMVIFCFARGVCKG